MFEKWGSVGLYGKARTNHKNADDAGRFEARAMNGGARLTLIKSLHDGSHPQNSFDIVGTTLEAAVKSSLICTRH